MSIRVSRLRRSIWMPIRANRLIETAQNQIGSFQKVLDTIQARVDEGRELPIEVHQAQFNLTRARVRLKATISNPTGIWRNTILLLRLVTARAIWSSLPRPTERLRPPRQTRPPQFRPRSRQARRSSGWNLLWSQKGLRSKRIEAAQRSSRKVDLVAQYALFGKYNSLQDYLRPISKEQRRTRRFNSATLIFGYRN